MIIYENTEPELNFFNSLRGFIKGKITANDFKESESDIYKINVNNKILAQSKIIFDLGDDENFFKYLNLSEDDAWFARWIYRSESYGGSNFGIESYDSLYDGLMQGYGGGIYELDSDNKQKLINIIAILTGKKPDLQSETDLVLVAKTLEELFERELSQIVSEYHYYLNEEIRITAKESIMGEINDFLEDIGFSLVNGFEMVSTTPANLLMWFTLLNKYYLSFSELFREIVESKINKRNYIGGWFDNQYEFRDSENFDYLAYNQEIYRILDNIENKIEESPKYVELAHQLTKITDNFDFGKQYKFLSNPDWKFEILGFDSDKNKLNLQVYNSSVRPYQKKFIKLSIDKFLEYYRQPTLFNFDELLEIKK